MFEVTEGAALDPLPSRAGSPYGSLSRCARPPACLPTCAWLGGWLLAAGAGCFSCVGLGGAARRGEAHGSLTRLIADLAASWCARGGGETSACCAPRPTIGSLLTPTCCFLSWRPGCSSPIKTDLYGMGRQQQQQLTEGVSQALTQGGLQPTVLGGPAQQLQQEQHQYTQHQYTQHQYTQQQLPQLAARAPLADRLATLGISWGEGESPAPQRPSGALPALPPVPSLGGTALAALQDTAATFGWPGASSRARAGQQAMEAAARGVQQQGSPYLPPQRSLGGLAAGAAAAAAPSPSGGTASTGAASSAASTVLPAGAASSSSPLTPTSATLTAAGAGAGAPGASPTTATSLSGFPTPPANVAELEAALTVRRGAVGGGSTSFHLAAALGQQWQQQVQVVGASPGGAPASAARTPLPGLGLLLAEAASPGGLSQVPTPPSRALSYGSGAGGTPPTGATALRALHSPAYSLAATPQPHHQLGSSPSLGAGGSWGASPLTPGCEGWAGLEGAGTPPPPQGLSGGYQLRRLSQAGGGGGSPAPGTQYATPLSGSRTPPPGFPELQVGVGGGWGGIGWGVPG